MRLKANKTSLYNLVATYKPLPGMRRVDFQKANGRPDYWLEWTTDPRCVRIISPCDCIDDVRKLNARFSKAESVLDPANKKSVILLPDSNKWYIDVTNVVFPLPVAPIITNICVFSEAAI